MLLITLTDGAEFATIERVFYDADNSKVRCFERSGTPALQRRPRPSCRSFSNSVCRIARATAATHVLDLEQQLRKNPHRGLGRGTHTLATGWPLLSRRTRWRNRRRVRRTSSGEYVYNYFRDYDAVTGRYIQSDPIGLAGGINTYGYAARIRPRTLFDQFGLEEGSPPTLRGEGQSTGSRGATIKALRGRLRQQDLFWPTDQQVQQVRFRCASRGWSARLLHSARRTATPASCGRLG